MSDAFAPIWNYSRVFGLVLGGVLALSRSDISAALRKAKTELFTGTQRVNAAIVEDREYDAEPG